MSMLNEILFGMLNADVEAFEKRIERERDQRHTLFGRPLTAAAPVAFDGEDEESDAPPVMESPNERTDEPRLSAFPPPEL